MVHDLFMLGSEVRLEIVVYTVVCHFELAMVSNVQ